MPESGFPPSIPEATISDSFLSEIKSVLSASPSGQYHLQKMNAEASHHQVWQISSEGSIQAYLKIFGNHLAYSRELAFYQDHSLALVDNIPQLLSFGHQLLLGAKQPFPYILSKALNCPPAQTPFQLPKDGELYRLAGALLARVHQLPLAQTDPLPINEALHLRTEHCLSKYSSMIEKTDKEKILQLKNEIRVESDVARVLCHRDYQAKNWHYESGRFQILDFEHSRADYYLQDFSKIAYLIDPALFTTFVRAYGISLSPPEQSELKLLSWHHALTSMEWAKNNKSESLLVEASQIIRRLRDESNP